MAQLSDDQTLGSFDATIAPPADVTIGPPADVTIATPRGITPEVSAGVTTGMSGDETTLTPSRPAAPDPKRLSDEGPLHVGQQFGPRYQIIRLLGIGGMGAVYQAWDGELDVVVALKVIRPEATADPEQGRSIERRFKQELLLARQVTHKNVVRIHDLGEIDGIKYITMSYIHGEDLATVLKTTGTLPVTDALRTMRQIASGLQAAHEAGVVHRDLKPANIMVKGDSAIIMDFGIARSAAPEPAAIVAAGIPAGVLHHAHAAALHTMAGAIMGTVSYMAPEQASGEPADQRSDIYALGLIVSDMLLGVRPRQGGLPPFEELKQRMKEAPPSIRGVNPQIPEALDLIVSRCVHPDPAARFQTTGELVAALDRLNDKGEPLPLVRRLTPRMVVAAALLLGVSLAGTSYLTRRAVAPVVTPDPVSVVIADFQNNTSDPAFDDMLGPTLKRALESASFITAFDRTRIAPTFGVQPAEEFNETAATQLAVQQGLGVVLAGSIAPRGTGYDISLQATRPLTGEAVASFNRRASSKDEVLDAVTRMVTGVRRALGDATSDADQLLAMRSISTTSLDVARLYSAALVATSKGRFQDAFDNYAKAIELDPKFGLGYQGLATMSRNLGRLQESEKYAAEALQYVDVMTEREKLQMRGYYFNRTGDYQQCIREYGELIARYPADTSARNQRAVCLARMRDMRGAMNELRRVVEILPNSVVYRSNLAGFLTYSGEYAAAEEEISKLPEPSPQTVAVLAFAQLGQGRVEDAAGTYNRLSTMGAWGAAFSTAGLADLAFYEGRFSDAVRLFREGAMDDLAAKNPDAAAMKFASLAYVHLARNERRAAAAAADNALQHSRVAPIRFLAARAFLETGDIARARTLAEGFASGAAGAEQDAYGKIIEGGIALKSGDTRQAIAILTEANGILDTWVGHFDLGRAYFEARMFVQADAEFDRCLLRRGEALALVDEDPTYGHLPAVYYYQGRIREELKTSDFTRSYREYLTIRGASREDPLLPDVRRRAQ